MKLTKRSIASLLLLGGIGIAPVAAADLASDLQTKLAPQPRTVLPAWPLTAKPATSGMSRDTLGESPLVSKKKPFNAAARDASWTLPTVPQAREAVWSPLERIKPVWNQASVEQSLPVVEEKLQGPHEVVLPTSPRVLQQTIAPAPLPTGDRFAREIESLPKMTEDPAASVTHGFLVRPQALAVAAPPPLLRLSIPDPDAAVRAVRIESVVAPEGDSYSIPREIPARPILPVK